MKNTFTAVVLSTVLLFGLVPGVSAQDPMSSDCDISGQIVSCSTGDPVSRVRGGDGWRTWKITYNSALSLHEAAVPTGYAKPGTHLKIVYRGRTLKVHAISGGCSCFDISDEGFRKLAGSTSKGVIRAKVKKL